MENGKIALVDDAGYVTRMSPPSNTTGADREIVVAEQSYVDNKPSGFKNLLINPGFDIWQRGTSFTVGSTKTYTADRFMARDVANIYSSTDVPPNKGFTTSLRVETGSSFLDPWVLQAIEIPDRLVGKTVTFSYYVKAIGGVLRHNYYGVDRGLPIVIDNTWVKVEDTFDVTTSNDGKLYIQFEVGVTASYYITGVQLEEGSVATPFEQRPIGLELSLCQRYYQKSYPVGIEPGTSTNSGKRSVPVQHNGNRVFGDTLLAIEMRVAPQVVLYSKEGVVNSINPYNNGAGNEEAYVAASSTTSIGVFIQSVNSLATTIPYECHFTADAEIY